MKIAIITGIALIAFSWIFGFAETWYFGWNLLPKTKNEFVCDLISIIADFIGWLVVFITVLNYIWRSIF